MTILLLIITLQGQTPSLQAVARDVDQAERWELREPGSNRLFYHTFALDSARLARSRSEIEAYLRAKPDDPEALVLLGRIGRFLLGYARQSVCPSMPPCVLDSTFNEAPYHAALDRVLTLRSHDAAAHYWKARLLNDGRTVPLSRHGDFVVEVDTGEVLLHARHAVSLEPRSVRYREFLAVKLAYLGRYGEAADAIQPVESGTHILSLMFQDLDAVPVVEGAIPWPMDAAFAAVGLDENPPRFAELAARAWVSTLTVQQVEAFYRRRWPNFRFFPVPGDSSRQGGMQYLSPGPDGVLRPAEDASFFTQLENATEYPGLILGVSRAWPPFIEPGARHPASIEGKDSVSQIILVTGRRARRT